MLKNRNLKIGVFTSPQSGDVEFERYVIENERDLILFFKAFPNNPKSTRQSWIRDLNDERIIIAQDPNRFTGMNTYCYEAKPDKEQPHPSDHIRVRLIN